MDFQNASQLCAKLALRSATPTLLKPKRLLVAPLLNMTEPSEAASNKAAQGPFHLRSSRFSFTRLAGYSRLAELSAQVARIVSIPRETDQQRSQSTFRNGWFRVARRCLG